MSNSVSIISEECPQDGQKSRSSKNFSSKDLPHEPIVWCCPDGISFTVMEDKSAASDKTIYKNVKNGTITKYYEAKNLYIANPQNARANFEVKVISVRHLGMEELVFTSVSDIHVGADTDVKVCGNYDSKDRLQKLKTLLNALNSTFTIIQGDLTTGTTDSQKDMFNDFAKDMEDNYSHTICEGWGNHDLYYYGGSGNVGNMVKDRTKQRRYERLPNFQYTGPNNQEWGHYCYSIDLVKNDCSVKIPVYFFMLNLLLGEGNQIDENEARERNMHNPMYSKEFLEEKLPENKNALIFVAVHYPQNDMNSSDKTWFEELRKRYPNMYFLVGHNHSIDYGTPNVGYRESTHEFLCAGGMANDNLRVLSIKLQPVDAKQVKMSFKWVSNLIGYDVNSYLQSGTVGQGEYLIKI